MMSKKEVQLIPIEGFPMVQSGDEISSLIQKALAKNHITLVEGDVIVVTHSIVSIAEGSLYQLDEVEVSERAKALAEGSGHAPEVVEVALTEASEILREESVLITKTRHGVITDYSGVDESNAPLGKLIALPENPDDSAKKIHDSLSESNGFNVPVIVTDTQGRPWRKGAVNLAIGIAGMSPFTSNAGKEDIFGHKLRGSLVCLADQIAAAAELVMGQADEGIPIVVVRGINFMEDDGNAFQIIRSNSESLFG
jgi:coenzyme F420-0:L-glutamate ligase/coenzyme F420-1:gamma-L-glutamate ligase